MIATAGACALVTNLSIAYEALTIRYLPDHSYKNVILFQLRDDEAQEFEFRQL